MTLKTATSAKPQERLSCNEMRGLIIGQRVGGLQTEQSIKMKMYMEILVSSCELELWEPLSPNNFLDLLNVPHI